MTDRSSNGSETIYDLIGVGFGPSNMAVAIAMEENDDPAARGMKRLFLETKPVQRWHPGMLLEGAVLQISVFKDLATLYNPRSRYTFLNYLNEKGRLSEFLNLRDFYPTRVEYDDYVRWAGNALSQYVRFGTEVVSVTPVEEPGKDVELLEVMTRDVTSGETETLLTRNLTVAIGPQPKTPPGIELKSEGRVIHSHSFMIRKARDFPSVDDDRRFLVVGGGQSGAELFHYLMTRYPKADVTMANRHFSIKPVDDSDFSNEVFFPKWVDFTYNLPDDKRKQFLAEMRSSNYEVVEHELINRIYRELYVQKVQGQDRARILRYMNLERLEEHDSGVTAHFRDLMHDHDVTLEADTVILCTGYAWRKEQPLLDGLTSYFSRGDNGKYAIERDYSLTSKPSLRSKVYLQGYSDDKHGITDTLLSIAPVRANTIVNSMLGKMPGEATKPVGAGSPEPQLQGAV